MSHPQAEDSLCQEHVTLTQYRAATTNACGLKICPHCLHHRWSSFSLPAFVWPPMQFYGGTKRVLLACVSVCVCVCVFIFRVLLCVLKWVSLDHMLMGVFGKNYWDNNCSCFFRAWPSHSYESISPLRNVKIIQGKSFTSQKRLIPSPPTQISALHQMFILCFVVTQHPSGCGVEINAPDISSLSGKPTRRHPPGIPSQFCKESICHPQSPPAHPPPPFVWQSGCKMENWIANWLSLYVTSIKD